MANFTPTRVEEIFTAAAILRNLKADEFTTGILKLLAEGLTTAVVMDDMKHFVRIKRAVRKVRDKSNNRDLQAALSGVIVLLIL